MLGIWSVGDEGTYLRAYLYPTFFLVVSAVLAAMAVHHVRDKVLAGHSDYRISAMRKSLLSLQPIVGSLVIAAIVGIATLLAWVRRDEALWVWVLALLMQPLNLYLVFRARERFRKYTEEHAVDSGQRAAGDHSP